jgi:hypothetical protein
MKDQITTLMEALRLAGREVNRFKMKRQGCDETLDVLEAILYDPNVRQAVETLDPLIESPSIVPVVRSSERV